MQNIFFLNWHPISFRTASSLVHFFDSYKVVSSVVVYISLFSTITLLCIAALFLGLKILQDDYLFGKELIILFYRVLLYDNCLLLFCLVSALGF